jgi:ATP-dependent HslUV protease ATP-binding subunit HslU
MVDLARQAKPVDPAQRRPGDPDDQLFASDLTPKQIVAELDRYVIGQHDAKRAVSIALRNRFRRQRVSEDIRAEIHPRNVLMIGPTGVGKTEIARRVAKIVDAPFIKVEATKFTEVGYVGRDVESIIRDLVEIAVSALHTRRLDDVMDQASSAARQQIAGMLASETDGGGEGEPGEDDGVTSPEAEHFLSLLDTGELDDRLVEIDVEDDSEFEGGVAEFSGSSPEELQDPLMEFMESMFARRRVRRRVPVREARRILAQQEASAMVDANKVIDDAIRRVEQTGVVFIDELDKTVTSDGDGGPDVSGEGVQRDLLPIIEGSTVMTRFGPVHTDHILFIGAGAFHRSRPSDLIPEIQGRFPVRVELESLTEDDLYAILTQPENSLVRQYTALLATEDVTLELVEDGMRAVAHLATVVNERIEDIGARRLHTMMERVLEDVSFEASDMAGQTVKIDEEYVLKRLDDVADEDDLGNYIL